MDRIDKMLLAADFVLLATWIALGVIDFGWGSVLNTVSCALLGATIGINVWDWWRGRK